ncbi:sodium:calcium antiporter [Patescibacteria group bacterium]|nr:sodium:calcium antiporter [Patescibacteria group bacterium]
MIFDILGIVASSVFLILATRMAIGAFERLVVKLKVDGLVLAAIMVALSTSLPELFVGIAAALEGTPEISLGNVLGSNVANVSLVIGGASLIAGSVSVVGDFMKREFIAAFLAGLMPLFLMLDGKLSRLDGIILLVAYAFYIRDVVIAGKHKSLAERGGKKHGLLTRLEWIHGNHVDKWVLKLALGLAGVIVGADLLVRFASGLAGDLGVPVFLIGILVVSVGTSLPELVLETQAIRKKNVALVFGDLLGSTVANSTLIIGVTSLIHPIEIMSVSRLFVAGGTFIVVFSLFWAFSMTKKKLDRWEALVLLGLYVMFVGLELLVG